jgi:hypothetical protein
VDEEEGTNIDLPYPNKFEDLDIEDLLHNVEENIPAIESIHAILFALIYIHFGFSEREADADL